MLDRQKSLKNEIGEKESEKNINDHNKSTGEGRKPGHESQSWRDAKLSARKASDWGGNKWTTSSLVESYFVANIIRHSDLSNVTASYINSTYYRATEGQNSSMKATVSLEVLLKLLNYYCSAHSV